MAQLNNTKQSKPNYDEHYTQHGVLTLESRNKGSNDPSLTSPVVDEEGVRPFGDFPRVIFPGLGRFVSWTRKLFRDVHWLFLNGN